MFKSWLQSFLLPFPVSLCVVCDVCLWVQACVPWRVWRSEDSSLLEVGSLLPLWADMWSLDRTQVFRLLWQMLLPTTPPYHPVSLFCIWISTFLTGFVEETMLSHWGFLCFCWNHCTVYPWVSFWTLFGPFVSPYGWLCCFRYSVIQRTVFLLF